VDLVVSGDLGQGVERASAVIVLNCSHTGRPEALLEASMISAWRTAASAAVAAETLRTQDAAAGVSLIGCGVINFEVLRFLRSVLGFLPTVTLFDIDTARAEAFVARCATTWPDQRVEVADRIETALGAHPLLCLATTAAQPYIGTEHCQPGALVLHLSLRDLTPESILSGVNLTDDPDHVCRADTSLHLAEGMTGNRNFIEASLGDVLRGAPVSRPADRITIFSPFGLGVLDLAVTNFVRSEAMRQEEIGTRLPAFTFCGCDSTEDPPHSASGVTSAESECESFRTKESGSLWDRGRATMPSSRPPRRGRQAASCCRVTSVARAAQ
jgi:2,3-diaminopropionate biosynthesis protein SbnB